MQLGMIGLGRMGSNMVRRLLRAGHECVVYDVHSKPVDALAREGGVGTFSMTTSSSSSRGTSCSSVWSTAAAGTISQAARGRASLPTNSLRRRAKALRPKGVHYVDVGTSGGVWGLERGFCQMIGGEPEVVRRLDAIFAALAPGIPAAPRTPGREKLGGTAERGYLHCGSNGAGHFVKMVHNGIEYGIMAAYSEGLNILRHANIGIARQVVDAETTPLRNPEHYQYEIALADVAEVWRRGSVIASWLLDLTAAALTKDSDLAGFEGRVSDSGEGRWTLAAAIDEAVPAPVLSAALYQRFSTRGEADFADKLLSAMRYEFGGHREQAAGRPGPP